MGDGPFAMRGRRPGSRTIPAVGGQVLCHEDDLAEVRRAVGWCTQGLDLDQDVLGRAGSLLAPERRDGTEATDAIAPLGDLYVGPGSAGRWAGQLQKVEAVRRRRRPGDSRSRREGDGHGCSGRCGEGIGERRPEAGHEIDLGEGVAQLVPVPLGHATGHHQACARPAVFGQGQDGVDRLLAGGVNEGARVDHDEVGLLGVRGAAVPLCSEIALQLVGVDLVLRAPQGLQPVEAHAFTHSSHQAGTRRGDETRQAHQGWANLPDCPAPPCPTPERRGRDLNPRTRLPRSTH